MKAMTVKTNEIANKFIDRCDEFENDLYWSFIEAPMETDRIIRKPVQIMRSLAERVAALTTTTKEN